MNVHQPWLRCRANLDGDVEHVFRSTWVIEHIHPWRINNEQRHRRRLASYPTSTEEDTILSAQWSQNLTSSTTVIDECWADLFFSSSGNEHQISNYASLKFHNTCPRSLINNSNPIPVVSATTTTRNSKTLSSHRITLSIQYTHHVLRRKIIAQPAWILLHRKQPTVHFTSTSYGMNFYNSTTDTTTKCLPNNSIENCLRQNEYYYLENDTTFEDRITSLVEWSWPLWHANCIDLKATFTERPEIETIENTSPLRWRCPIRHIIIPISQRPAISRTTVPIFFSKTAKEQYTITSFYPFPRFHETWSMSQYFFNRHKRNCNLHRAVDTMTSERQTTILQLQER